MKTKTKKKILVIFVSFIIIASIYFGFIQTAFSGNGIVVQGFPIIEENNNWANIDGNVLITSPYKGTISDAVGIAICGSNDGNFQISNSWSVGAGLTLSTSFRNQYHSGCDSVNYVKAEMLIPKGNLTISYSITASEGEDGVSGGSVKVDSFSVGANWRYECNRGQANINTAYWNSNCNAPKSGSETIVFNEPKNIDVEIISYQGYSGAGSSSVTLIFEPYVEIIEEPLEYFRFSNNECNSISLLLNNVSEDDYGSLSLCQENIVEDPIIQLFRFEDNSCYSVTIVNSGRTANDYDTLNLCIENIQSVSYSSSENNKNTEVVVDSNGAVIIQPTRDNNIFQKFWNWFMELFRK